MFTYYNQKPVPAVLTTQDLVASLTGAQKVAVLNGFAKDIKPKTLATKAGIPRSTAFHLYRKLDEIEETSRVLMRGELLITPEVVDPQTGEITSPAVYNTPPGTSAILNTAIATRFSVDFSVAQIGAILTKMYNYAKWDGSGTWTYYKTEVIK